ncbi:MAG: competence/damage-inducible protein A [Bacteroidetes bacterium]|nr:competence/damage-inducible protein A [Bacteroidota bacterium]
MNSEIITIGDELLIGQVIDTNSAWIGQELSKIGVKVLQKKSIGDTREAILDALYKASKKSSIVILTGGLGPTKDDITKHTLCEFFQTQLVQNEKVLKWVTSIFTMRNLPMLESNNQQAMVPENCEVLWNKNGTAPGMWFKVKDVIYISLPGVPFEMKTIFTEEVIPKLLQQFQFPTILHRTILTCNIGESFLAKRIENLENELPEHIKLAYLPSVGMVRLRFSAYGNNLPILENELTAIIEKLYKLIGNYIYGEGDDNLAEVLGKLLLQSKKSLATAESCSGGYIAHQITSIPGSSAYFKGAIISYDNSVKIEQLQVPANIIESNGAVSEACVSTMANNVRKLLKTDYAIATSGVAGPGGGTPEKPVGTVWIAVSSEKQTKTSVFNFGDNRERTIQRTAIQGLDMLRKLLVQENQS